MAKVHVLTMTQAGQFEALVHFVTPAGSNSAAVTWKAAAIAAGMIAQPANAQADADEKAAILAGETVEIAVTLGVNPKTMTAGAITTALDAAAEAAKADWLKDAQARLRYYGYKQGTVS